MPSKRMTSISEARTPESACTLKTSQKSLLVGVVDDFGRLFVGSILANKARKRNGAKRKEIRWK